MHPVLFKIGSFTVYSYGVLLVTAFVIGYYFFLQEVKRKKLDERIAIDITIIAVFCGVIGSKLLFVIENLDEFFVNRIFLLLSNKHVQILTVYVNTIIGHGLFLWL